MSLTEQSISFPFGGGVETKLDSKAVPPVRLLALENGVFRGPTTIRKRNGYSALSRAIDNSTSLVTGAKRLGQRDEELLLYTASRCYSKQTAADQWSDAGALIAPIGYDRPVVATSSQQTMPDHATLSGVSVYAWEDSRGGVYWTVEDASSGRVYRAPTQAHATGQRPRCLAVGQQLHVYYAVPTSQYLYCLVINPSIPSADVAPQLLLSDLDSTNPAYDAVSIGDSAVIAWHEHATTNIRVGYVTAAGALGSPSSGFPSVARDAAALATGSPIGVAYLDNDVAEISVVFQTSTSLVAHAFTVGSTLSHTGTSIAAVVTDVERVTCVYATDGTGALWVAAEENDADASEHYVVTNWVIPEPLIPIVLPPGTPATVYVGTAATIRSVGLASRGFIVNDNPMAVFVHDTTYFNTYVTLRLSDFAPVGRHHAGGAFGLPTRGHVSSVHVDAGDIARVSLPIKQRLQSENNDKFGESSLSLISLDFDSGGSHQGAQLGRGLYLAGACPMHYDGRVWTEQGFHFGPEKMSAVAASGGSMTAGSTYQYKVWYEWPDAQGEIHRGPESVPLVVVTGVGQTQVTLTLPTLRVTKKPNVRICVGRSIPGDASRLWRVSSLDPTTAGAVNGYIANDTTVDSVTFIDRMSDANVQEEEPLYTTNGVLSNDPATLGSHVVAGKNRLFFTDASAGNIVRCTKRLAFGYGAEIAPEMQHDVDPYGGDITALAVMDDVVFVFKASAIFAFNGDGPFEDGTTSSGNTIAGFSSSQLITSDVGCDDPSSIVLTPQGLMFKSAKGIQLLTRSREVLPIGEPVAAYDSQSVRRAIVLPDRTAVMFLTDSGSTLYFDYRYAQWSTFTNHEGYDAAVVGGEVYYLRKNDVVFRETIGTHSDAGSRIKLMLETAWLHMHQHLQGFQRFWKLLLLGTWVSPHQLGVSYRLSYDEAWSEPYWLDATGEASGATGWITGDSANTIGEDPILGSDYGDGLYGDGVYGGAGPDVYQWRYGIHEKGQSVQMRFEDFEKAGLAGASFELTEMTIVGGIMKPDIRPFSGARST